MKRSHLSLLALLVTIAASGVSWGPWLWDKLAFETEYTVVGSRAVVEFVWFRGASREKGGMREPPHGLHSTRAWSLDTGLLVAQSEIAPTVEGRRCSRETIWNPDGTLRNQQIAGFMPDLPQRRQASASPWLFGKTDQTEPSLPAWLRKWAQEEIAKR